MVAHCRLAFVLAVAISHVVGTFATTSDDHLVGNEQPDEMLSVTQFDSVTGESVNVTAKFFDDDQIVIVEHSANSKGKDNTKHIYDFAMELEIVHDETQRECYVNELSMADLPHDYSTMKHQFAKIFGGAENGSAAAAAFERSRPLNDEEMASLGEATLLSCQGWTTYWLARKSDELKPVTTDDALQQLARLGGRTRSKRGCRFTCRGGCCFRSGCYICCGFKCTW